MPRPGSAARPGSEGRLNRRGLSSARRRKAQETFTEARDGAVRTDGGRGTRWDWAAYAEFKRKFEKRGDHWIPKRSADSGI